MYCTTSYTVDWRWRAGEHQILMGTRIIIEHNSVMFQLSLFSLPRWWWSTPCDMYCTTSYTVDWRWRAGEHQILMGTRIIIEHNNLSEKILIKDTRWLSCYTTLKNQTLLVRFASYFHNQYVFQKKKRCFLDQVATNECVLTFENHPLVAELKFKISHNGQSFMFSISALKIQKCQNTFGIDGHLVKKATFKFWIDGLVIRLSEKMWQVGLIFSGFCIITTSIRYPYNNMP